MVPAIRVRAVNAASENERGHYVLYWMTSARRRHYNFALQHAAERAEALRVPLVVVEALRVGYKWASDRLHGFVLDGMHANTRAFADGKARYYAYVEPERGAGQGLLHALAEDAALVVADYFPAFFLPRMLHAASKQLRVRLDAVDGNGLLPIAAAKQSFPTAYAFRRHLQKTLPAHLDDASLPLADALASASLPKSIELVASITKPWPMASDALLARDPVALATLPIDHEVGVTEIRGGDEAASSALDAFFDDALERYGEERNHPDDGAASGLSPYLHFGHLSVHEVFARLVERESWTAAKLGKKTLGKREGWWNMSAPAESFLDEIVTWRELGYNHCTRNPTTYDRYESLPEWARRTLEAHERDPRDPRYTLVELREARTYDEVWNAAQRELVREGRMHNYLRMLWGKKILEWTQHPREALDVMIELNNRYALDGRDPNSYSGIFWCLGRYDRPWFPERPIFGNIRYMSSESTLKKLRLKTYLTKHAG